jgi:hypothetical protein
MQSPLPALTPTLHPTAGIPASSSAARRPTALPFPLFERSVRPRASDQPRPRAAFTPQPESRVLPQPSDGRQLPGSFSPESRAPSPNAAGFLTFRTVQPQVYSPESEAQALTAFAPNLEARAQPPTAIARTPTARAQPSTAIAPSPEARAQAPTATAPTSGANAQVSTAAALTSKAEAPLLGSMPEAQGLIHGAPPAPAPTPPPPNNILLSQLPITRSAPPCTHLPGNFGAAKKEVKTMKPSARFESSDDPVVCTNQCYPHCLRYCWQRDLLSSWD